MITQPGDSNMDYSSISIVSLRIMCDVYALCPLFQEQKNLQVAKSFYLVSVYRLFRLTLSRPFAYALTSSLNCLTIEYIEVLSLSCNYIHSLIRFWFQNDEMTSILTEMHVLKVFSVHPFPLWLFYAIFIYLIITKVSIHYFHTFFFQV